MSTRIAQMLLYMCAYLNMCLNPYKWSYQGELVTSVFPTVDPRWADIITIDDDERSWLGVNVIVKRI